MTPLTQQLKDKKKELLDIEQGIKILEISECSKDSNCHEYSDLINEKEYYRHCKEIIAILEQAITEMQKQRQEDFKKLVSKLKSCDEFFNVRGYENTISTDKFMGIVHLFIHQIEQEQLNQPKTEQ